MASAYQEEIKKLIDQKDQMSNALMGAGENPQYTTLPNNPNTQQNMTQYGGSTQTGDITGAITNKVQNPTGSIVGAVQPANNFVNAAKQAGMYDQFSQWDLDMAAKYPEFGYSMLSYKQDYANATTDEQRALINAQANQLRTQYGNYTAGDDGSKYYSGGLTPGSYNSAYSGMINDALNGILNYGGFSYGEAPTYTNPYASQQQALLDQMVNYKDFSYNKDEDPQWGAYRKQYLREGDRATANALAQASAASGGVPSSYAMTAASQAGDYYAGQLADILPQLYQQAYNKYLDEYSRLQSNLNQTNTQQQLGYQEYLNNLNQYNTDRNFAYSDYLNQYNMLTQNLSTLQGLDDAAYNKVLNQIDFNTQQQATNVANALSIWQLYGYATEDVAAALGVPVGTPTSDQSYRDWQIALEEGKYSGGGYQTPEEEKEYMPDDQLQGLVDQMLLEGMSQQEIMNVLAEMQQEDKISKQQTSKLFKDMVNYAGNMMSDAQLENSIGNLYAQVDATNITKEQWRSMLTTTLYNLRSQGLITEAQVMNAIAKHA